MVVGIVTKKVTTSGKTVGILGHWKYPGPQGSSWKYPGENFFPDVEVEDINGEKPPGFSTCLGGLYYTVIYMRMITNHL